MCFRCTCCLATLWILNAVGPVPRFEWDNETSSKTRELTVSVLLDCFFSPGDQTDPHLISFHWSSSYKSQIKNREGDASTFQGRFSISLSWPRSPSGFYSTMSVRLPCRSCRWRQGDPHWAPSSWIQPRCFQISQQPLTCLDLWN